jgi:Family of unknown function (DUF6308)
VVDDGSDADRLWDKLIEMREVGPVIAGKLLARKRPHLIPLYDDFVAKAMAARKHWWVSLRDALQDKALRDQLEQLRASSKIGDDISMQRVLDISIGWPGLSRRSNATSRSPRDGYLSLSFR